MIYYVKENVLIASEISIDDSSFAEISEEDYDARLMLAQQCREQGVEINEEMESEVELW